MTLVEVLARLPPSDAARLRMLVDRFYETYRQKAMAR